MPKTKLPLTLKGFFFYLIKAHPWQMVGFTAPMVYSAVHLSIEPYALKLLIDRVIDYKGDPQHLLSSQSSLLLLFFGVSLGITVAWRLKDAAAIYLLPDLKSKVIETFFSYATGHSHRFYQDQFAGNITHKIKDISTGLEDLIETFREIFRQIAIVSIASLMLLTVHFQFALLIFVWALAFVWTGWILSRSITSRAEVFAEKRSILFGDIVDSISNQSNVRLFSREHFERNRLKGALKTVSEAEKQLRWKLIKLWSIQGCSATLMLMLMLFGLLTLRSQGKVTVGDFAFVTWVAVALVDQVWTLTETLSKLPQHIGICKQALLLVETPHEITDEPQARTLTIAKGEILYKNVTFSHRDSTLPDLALFKNLSVRIPPGSKTGLVGISGSGKSSFVHLLTRLFDVQSGQILIDGQEISKLKQSSLREQISFIPQDSALFHRTLRENIRYGRLDSTDREVEIAAMRAHAHSFILKTEMGYDSMVGERGFKLSGGQRQRIAIARAILKDAPILILDEATSALDSTTELQIQESLESLMRGKTTLVIAHRLSTLLSMDHILVFDCGRIVEQGSHSELLKNKGIYAELWRNQSTQKLSVSPIVHSLSPGPQSNLNALG